MSGVGNFHRSGRLHWPTAWLLTACALPTALLPNPVFGREIGPTFFFAPPRLFEAQLTDIMVRMQDAGALL